MLFIETTNVVAFQPPERRSLVPKLTLSGRVNEERNACSTKNKLVSFEQEWLILFEINCEPGYPECKTTYFIVQDNLIQTFKDLFICITLTSNPGCQPFL